MILRIRSRDGTDRITVPDPASATVADLQRLIESHLTVPVTLQRLSLEPALLLPSPSAVPLLADPAAQLASLRLANGAFVYLAYPPDAGFLYGRVDAETKEVFVDFIYEPPQQGSEDVVHLMRDADEEARVDAIAEGLGMRRVGLVFTQAVGRKASDTGEYTMSNREVVQAAQLQAEGGIPEWITAIVKLEVGDDGTGDVHFEAFQMSEICVKLFKDGVLETEVGDTDDPRLSKMRKEVVAGGKDTMEVDNDFFLVPVKISDHQGPLSVGFPIENRGSPVGMSALRSHLDRTKHLTFVRRISDFHLLLKIATFLDVKADVPTLAACVKTQSRVPEGYQLLIESLASQG